MMDCPEEKNVKPATFLLEGNAEDRWILYVVRVGGVVLVTWKGFQEKFYFCSFIDEKKRRISKLGARRDDHHRL